MTDYRPIYDWAKSELEGELKRHEGRKKDIILEAATRLEKSGMPKKKVGAALGNELEKAKLATKRYVQKCLSEDVKRDYHSVKNEIKSEQVRNETINTTSDPQADQIVISNEGKPVAKEEKDIFSIIDWKRFHEAEEKGLFKPDPKKIPGAQIPGDQVIEEEERDGAAFYKKAYEVLYHKLTPFKKSAVLIHNGVVVPVIVEVKPVIQEVTVTIDERASRP